MGHGCYYTHEKFPTKNQPKAFWVCLDDIKDEHPDTFRMMFDDEMSNISSELENMGYKNFENGLFDIILSETYGNDILVRLEPKHEDQSDAYEVRCYNLACGVHSHHYEKIAKRLIAFGYHLRIATSGYTSMELNFNQ